jgi:hypothetical protein
MQYLGRPEVIDDFHAFMNENAGGEATCACVSHHCFAAQVAMLAPVVKQAVAWFVASNRLLDLHNDQVCSQGPKDLRPNPGRRYSISRSILFHWVGLGFAGETSNLAFHKDPVQAIADGSGPFTPLFEPHRSLLWIQGIPW